MKISFRAIKIKGKPVKVDFYNRNGKALSFKNQKHKPKIIKVEFYNREK